MYFNVNFNAFFNLIKVHLLINDSTYIRMLGAPVKIITHYLGNSAC